MSECYLIPIGGTGIRIMKAIVNLCMAGCFNGETFKVMCVDSDGTNGNSAELINLLREYRNVGNNLFPEIKLNVVDDKEFIIWSPLSGENKDKQSSMSEMTSQSAMSKDARQVFELLYTSAERNKKLEGGFYGHTSIGSYFMAQEVVKDGKLTKVWSNFFGDNGEDKKINIFILGSVFGGTGASGVPTIAKLIKKQYPKANIGALLVMPYFNPQNENEDDISNELVIDGNSFTAKTKTALSFYDRQNFKDIFSNMYFIGEKNGLLRVRYHDSGEHQKNKATPMEVFAATALLDFLGLTKDDNETSKDGSISIFWKELSDNENPDVITQKMLDFNKIDVFDKMTEYLRFSILYTKCLYPYKKQNYPKFFKKYDGTPLKNYRFLKNACVDYIEWIKDLILDNDGSGNIDYNNENRKVKWFNYKGYEPLYDHNELKITDHAKESIFSKTKDKKVFDYSELEKMNNIVKNAAKKKADGSYIVRDFLNKKGRSNSESKTIEDLYHDVMNVVKFCDSRK